MSSIWGAGGTASEGAGTGGPAASNFPAPANNTEIWDSDTEGAGVGGPAAAQFDSETGDLCRFGNDWFAFKGMVPPAQTVYKLTHCDDASVHYTTAQKTSGIADEVGNIVTISEHSGCFTVSTVADTGGNAEELTLVESYGACQTCSDAQPSAVPCTDCAAATNVPTVSGWVGDYVGLSGCGESNSSQHAYSFLHFSDAVVRYGASVCLWSFRQTTNPLDQAEVTVYFWKTTPTSSVTEICGGTPQPVAGNYSLYIDAQGTGAALTEEVASNILCNAGGQLSGSHTFSFAACPSNALANCRPSIVTVSF